MYFSTFLCCRSHQFWRGAWWRQARWWLAISLTMCDRISSGISSQVRPSWRQILISCWESWIVWDATCRMPACTSSPINEYSWRKEVESRPLILDFGLCQIITDAYQQIADQFLKWLLSLNSSYTGVSWSSCHFTEG